MKHFVTELSPLISKKHACNICNYNTCKFTDYKKHLQTKKHQFRENETNETKMKHKVAENLYCICGATFNNRTTLWRHKKKCDKNEIDTKLTEYDKDELIIKLLKQNAELVKGQQDIINNLIQNGLVTNNNSNNTTNNNTTNNSFNLQFFLNETCKNAMNINEFVSSIKVNLEELENTGRQGYIEGVSNIILKRLNNLEQPFRPLHCSDSKREVFYIKDNNEWQKETEDKPILTRAIKTIANENIKQIKCWQDKYPDCTKSDSKKNDLYLKIVSNSMNGSTKEEGLKNINKIISNVAKEVIIIK